MIYVKQTKSKRVSDTVYFKTKYITQPTLTQADMISKALNDLTQALKGKNNQQGIEKMEALQKLDAILNNKPDQVPTTTATRPTQRRITFDEAANQTMRRKRSKRKGARSTTTHQFANTAARNIQPKQKTSAGSSRRTTPVRPTGSQQKAPEGARGP